MTSYYNKLLLLIMIYFKSKHILVKIDYIRIQQITTTNYYLLL